ncbi:DUF1043 family protein [[Haemophilus] felis]|nr:DUF1043 family protein [[Haemophilus] felis]
MQNWTPEMWQAAAIGLVIGLILGYLLLRITKDSVKKQIKTETELQNVKSQLDSQKEQLEKHFAKSADLLKNLAQDYQKLYQHLAKASTDLLPEHQQPTLFAPQLLSSEPTDSVDEKEDNLDTQPKDYSGQPSGLLKESTSK